MAGRAPERFGVFKIYGGYSAWFLRNLSHSEAPWKDAVNEGKNEITNEALLAFFPSLCVDRGDKAQNIALSVVEITGDPVCIDVKKAQPVYERLLFELRKGNKVALSFAGVTRIISAFIGAAIGPLYNPELNLPNDIDEALRFEDADEDTLIKISQVRKYSKLYYTDPQALREIVEAEY